MRKKAVLTGVSLFMVGLFLTGSISIMAEHGDSSDPIVTKSYIDSVLTPSVNQKITEAVNQKINENKTYIDTALSNHKALIDQKISQTGSSSGGSLSQADIDRIADRVVADIKNEGIAAGPSWSVISVGAGKTLVGDVGTELLLRIGSATCYSPGSVGIVNLTGGNTLSPGAALAANNLYLVSIDGRGIKAGSSGATILISGGYSIS